MNPIKKRIYGLSLALLASAAIDAQAAAIPIATLKRTTPVDFEKEVLPILRNNCLACHNKTKAKADLILETPKDILKGGDSGPAVVPKKGAGSLLLELAAHQDEDSVMPPEGNKVQAKNLTAEQLGLIKLWIDQGATGEVLGASNIDWQPLPAGFNPIYAVALTADGDYAACGRANQIFVYHLPSGKLVTRLTDPALLKKKIYKNPGVAHLDMVNSLAFSPDGTLLASGGYREVKLWRRPLGSRQYDWSAAKGEVTVVVASPDGKSLATGGSDGSVKLWNLSDGKPGKATAGHAKAIMALAFSPDGSQLASASEDRSIRVWRTADGSAFSDVQANDAVRALAWAKDGGRLISAGDDKLIRIWKLPAANAVADKAKRDKAEAVAVKALEAVVASRQAAKKAVADRAKELKAAEAASAAVQKAWDKAVASAQAGDKAVAKAADEEKKKAAEAIALKAKMAVEAKLGELEAKKKALEAAADKAAKAKEALAQIESKVKTVEGEAFKAARLAAEAAMALATELTGHAAPVLSLASVPGAEDRLLSGAKDGVIRLWNLKDGKVVREIKHDEPVTALAVRPDGKRAVAAGPAKAASLWNLEDGKSIAELNIDRAAVEVSEAAVRTVAFGKAEVAYHKSELTATTKRNTTETARVKKATESVAAKKKAVDEKKKALVTATKGKTDAEKAAADLKGGIKKTTDAFNAATAAQKTAEAAVKAVFEKAAVAGAAADAGEAGKTAADKAAKAAAAKAEKNKEDKAAAGAAAKAKTALATATKDAAAKRKAADAAKAATDKAITEVGVKGFAAGKLKPEFDRITKDSAARIKAADAKVAAAVKTVVAAEPVSKKADEEKGRADNELKLAQAAQKRETAAVAAVKKDIAAAEAELKKMEAAGVVAKKRADSATPVSRAVAFSPDGLTVALAKADGRILLWSAETGAALESFGAHSKAVNSLVFAKDGRLVSGGADGKAQVWRSRGDWKLARTIGTGDGKSPLADRVNALAFSPDGLSLATGGGEPSRDGELKVWNVADGKLKSAFKQIHSDSVLDLEYSADGKRLASSAADRFVKIVDVASGKIVNSFEGHTHHVLGVSWKRDGRTLASGGADKAIKVWDVAKGGRKKSIAGFSKEVTSVSYVDNQNYFLAGAGDSAVRFVNEAGKTVRTFAGASDFVHSTAVTPDAKVVIAGGQDGVLRVWNGADGKLKSSFALPEAK